MSKWWVVGCLLWVVGCAHTLQTAPTTHDDALSTSIAGKDLAIKSSGQAWEDCWRLEQAGFVGTYVQLDSPGDVTISMDAFGGISKPARGNIAINDERVPLEIDAAWTTVRH